MSKQPRFLPMTLKEAQALGIKEFDVILVTGDAYVDHHSFGAALIERVLWDAGYSVGIIAQPDWKGMLISRSSENRVSFLALLQETWIPW